jgi:phage-related protein
VRKRLAALPEDVQDVFGAALLDVQYGDTPDGARPFGENLPHEI